MTDRPQQRLQAFPMSLLAQLRFPQLFAIFGALFLLDLFVPDILPFADEVLLGMLTLMTGMIRKRTDQPKVEKPPEKNITPASDPDAS